jgi:hypothetical protein
MYRRMTQSGIFPPAFGWMTYSSVVPPLAFALIFSADLRAKVSAGWCGSVLIRG